METQEETVETQIGRKAVSAKHSPAQQPMQKSVSSPERETLLRGDEQEIIRFNLDITAELNAKLEALAKRGGTSKVAVVRKAIALLFIITTALASGLRIGFVEDASLLTKEIIGIDL